ncbi:MAG: hypothetical protein J5685_09570 [Clostridiales bacterium]|nr:hypothetical protein [Clostridiales bacterium]
MSKSLSNHFHGTTGERRFLASQGQTEGDIINERVQGLDLREHPVKYQSSLSKRKIKEKIKNRTASRADYKKFDSMNRLAQRRKEGVKDFWKQERRRIKKGERTTRNWTAEQRNAILHNNIPKVNGKSMQGHHSYSVSKYPHLANKGEAIFPVTFAEHLYDWHGGNFRNSLPGKPFTRKRKGA